VSSAERVSLTGIRTPLLVMLAATGLSASACAAHRFEAPQGPWLPAPDAAQLWTEATAICRDTTAMRASLKLSSTRRVPGLPSATIGIAVTADGSIGLDARTSGQVIFRLGGNADRAVLLLSQGLRTVTAPAVEIVEALIGVRLSPARLLSILDGCPGVRAPFEHGERSGNLLRVTTGEGVVHLERTRERLRIRGGQIEGFHVSYERTSGPAPARVRIDSVPGRQPVVALSLQIIDAERNPDPPILPGVFVVNLPAGTTPMTLDELRAWRDDGVRP
jgi:hypothetical protein